MRNIYSKSEAFLNKSFTTLLVILSIILYLLSLSLDNLAKFYYNTFIIISIVVSICCTVESKTLKHAWHIFTITFFINLFLKLFGCIDFYCFLITILSAPTMSSAASRLTLQIFFDGVIKPAHNQRKRYERYQNRRNRRNHRKNDYHRRKAR